MPEVAESIGSGDSDATTACDATEACAEEIMETLEDTPTNIKTVANGVDVAGEIVRTLEQSDMEEDLADWIDEDDMHPTLMDTNGSASAPAANGIENNDMAPTADDTDHNEEIPTAEDIDDNGSLPTAPPNTPAEDRIWWSNDYFLIRRSALGGLGAFAAKDLKYGDRILVEKPLLRTINWDFSNKYEELSDEDRQLFHTLHKFSANPDAHDIEKIRRANS